MKTDFDEFKHLWEKDIQCGLEASPICEDNHLNQLIMNAQHQSGTAWSALKRKIIFEMLGGAAFIGLLYFVLKQSGRAFPTVVWFAIALLTLGGHIFYYIKMKNIDRLVEQNLKTALSERVKMANSFINLYEQGIKMLMAVIFGASIVRMWLTSYWFPQKIALIVIAAAACYGIVGFTKIFLEKYYGKHLRTMMDSAEVLNDDATQ